MEDEGKEDQGVSSLGLGLGILAIIGLLSTSLAQAVDFHCPTGDVACLINAINVAKANGAPNTIQLEAGAYVSTEVYSEIFEQEGPKAFPWIRGTMKIVGSEAEESILTQDSLRGRILGVALRASLTLEHITVEGGQF
jgi:hypothetical protein